MAFGIRKKGRLCCCESWGIAGLVALILVGAIRLPARGQERAELSSEERAAHLERMRSIATSFHIYELSGEKRLSARLADEPVLRYTDSTRKQYDSTIWVWGTKGRPSAMVAVEYYPERPRNQKWLYEIASLSPSRIAVERGNELSWTAREPGLNLRVLAGAPLPAEKPAARLGQMKGLFARFAAHEGAVVEGRIELRPMARPLYRYRDEAAGVIDGAIFSFANGTNPEVLWVIEAQSDDQKNESWHFGFVQMTGAEVIAELDGKELWKCREADPPAERESYRNGWFSPGDGK
jgi:hypothetical protein